MEEHGYNRKNKFPEEENEEKNEYKTVSLKKSSDLKELIGKNGKEKLGAVEGWNRHEVEDGEENIDEDYYGGDLNKSRVVRNTNAQKQTENERESDVRGWPSAGHGRFRPSTWLKVTDCTVPAWTNRI